ncbi:MAG: hypothetical protein AVDCRST_MAG67-3718, partial [uncultured Solirubrobacteraceae bacterium]
AHSCLRQIQLRTESRIEDRRRDLPGPRPARRDREQLLRPSDDLRPAALGAAGRGAVAAAPARPRHQDRL